MADSQTLSVQDPSPVIRAPQPDARLPSGVNIRQVVKTKDDLLKYYTDMSGNHLKYIVEGNHYEPEVGKEIKGMMKEKLLAEAKEERDRTLEEALRRGGNPMADDQWGQEFHDAQLGIKPTRKILNRMEQSVFETGYAPRFDGGLDNISRNPLERNILRAEHYTLVGTPDLDVLVNKAGTQDALGMIAQRRMGLSQTKAAYRDMYDVGVYNMQNAAPVLTAQRRNAPLRNPRPDLAETYVNPDDFMSALFRR